jgi:hypothetical protein
MYLTSIYRHQLPTFFLTCISRTAVYQRINQWMFHRYHILFLDKLDLLTKIVSPGENIVE